MSGNSRVAEQRVILCVTLLLTVLTSARAEKLPLKSYSTADGLAHNEVNRIVRDSRGFLWFCTAEGLSRFDGYNFTNFGIDQGLPHRVVNDFLETKNGELWVATNAGLVRFNPGGTPSSKFADAMFSVIVPEDTDRNARIFTVLVEARDGTIWCGTMKHLYRLDRQASQLVRVDIGGNPLIISVLDLIEDRQGTIWIGSFQGVFRRTSDGTVQQFTKQEGLPDNNIHDILEDHEGRIWGGTRLGGFFRFAGQIQPGKPIVDQVFNTGNGLRTNWVFHLYEASDRRFWVATNQGLVEFFPKATDSASRFRMYTRRNGLSFQEVTSLNEDIGGNLWLGTNVAGVMKLAHSGFVTYDERDAILSINAIFEDDTGAICFRGAVPGDQRALVFDGTQLELNRPNSEQYFERFGCLRGNKFEWFTPAGNYDFGWVSEQMVTRTPDGQWWLGGGAGAFQFPAVRSFAELRSTRPLKIYTTRDGLTANQVYRVFADSSGNVWISSFSLDLWDRASRSIKKLTASANLPRANDDFARAFGEDRDRRIWIGYTAGLARYDGKEFRFFGANEGFPSGSVMNIFSDRSGRLWIASARSGLIRVDDPAADKPTFRIYSTVEGLSSNTVEVIVEDLQGRIYAATGRGVDQLDPNTGRLKHFTSADGLTPGGIITAFRDRSGTLWFGTRRGLSKFVPAPEEQSAPPPILITNVSIADATHRVSAIGETEIVLPDIEPGQNQLLVNYVALSFVPGEVLRYQYKLDGSGIDWSVPNEQRSLNLASLAPGRYEFLVRAVNSRGVTSSTPAVIRFVVLRPFWQRWWFLLLSAVVIAAIAYTIYHLRLARFVELANVRTRIATDLHDDIGANLTKISVLSEVARQKGEQDGTLSSIARISRESVAAMSDIVWAINPERDNLNDLIRRMRLHAEETCLPNEIQLQFQAPADERLRLGIETRRTLFLIFKEAINNAARHSGCWRIEVALEVARDTVMLRISDNGLGFDAEGETEGNGLLSMQRRAREAGGVLTIASTPGGGTTVKLKLPYSHSQILVKRK